jgi:hypothetical protein
MPKAKQRQPRPLHLRADFSPNDRRPFCKQCSAFGFEFDHRVALCFLKFSFRLLVQLLCRRFLVVKLLQLLLGNLEEPVPISEALTHRFTGALPLHLKFFL